MAKKKKAPASKKVDKNLLRRLSVRGGMITPHPMNPFDGIDYAEKATAKIVAGPTYEKLVIISNVPKEAIAKVEIVRGGDTDYSLKGSQLVMLEAFKAMANAGTAINGLYYYVIPFADELGKSIDAQSLTSYITLPGENIHIDITLHDYGHADNTGGNTWPVTATIKGTAYTSPARAARLWLPQIKTITAPALAVGELEFYDLPQSALMRRLHINGDVTKVELKQDGKTRFKMTADEIAFELQRQNRGLAPQAGYIHIDFVGMGFSVADLFNPKSVEDLNLIMQVGTAGNIPILVESVKRVM